MPDRCPTNQACACEALPFSGARDKQTQCDWVEEALHSQSRQARWLKPGYLHACTHSEKRGKVNRDVDETCEAFYGRWKMSWRAIMVMFGQDEGNAIREWYEELHACVVVRWLSREQCGC